MSPERSHAYKRVMLTLESLGPSKLLADEQDRIRSAADHLLFSDDLAGEDTTAALADALLLCESLVSSGRWERVTADRLAADITECGPEPQLQVLEPAA